MPRTIAPQAAGSTLWKPGQSGNPGGRPKGAMARVKEALGGQPDLLIAVFVEIAGNTGAKDSDRITAARELWDRGWGRAPAFAPAEGGNPLGEAELDRAIDRIMAELAGRREATATGAASNGGVGGDGTP